MASFNKNPFLEDLFIKESTKINKIGDTNLRIVDETGKEVEGNVVYAKEHNVDRTPFVKLFDTTFLLTLGKSGITMFHYMVKHLIKYNQDYVVIYIDDVLSRTTYNAPKSAYKGINELINAKVLAKTTNQGMYWINPAILYKGERWYLAKKH